jgi:hypothetical protein
MSYHGDISKAGRHGVHATIWVVIITIVLLVGLGGFLLKTRPWVMEQERRQNVEYSIPTRQNQLLLLAEEWHEAQGRPGQQRAIEAQMREQAAPMRDEDIPAEARAILEGTGQ